MDELKDMEEMLHKLEDNQVNMSTAARNLHIYIIDVVMNHGKEMEDGSYVLMEEQDVYDRHDHDFAIVDISGDGMWQSVKIRGIWVKISEQAETIFILQDDDINRISCTAVSPYGYDALYCISEEICHILYRKIMGVHTQNAAPGNPS